MKTLKVLDDEGKPSISRWNIIAIDQLFVDIYWIKEQRAFTYIELPEISKLYVWFSKYTKNCDDECFKRVYALSSEREDEK